MLKALVIIIVYFAVVAAAMRAYKTWRMYRAGNFDAEPAKNSIGSLFRRKHRGRWRVVEEGNEELKIVKVEHPKEGVQRSWEVDLTGEDGRKELVRIRQDAESLVQELNER